MSKKTKAIIRLIVKIILYIVGMIILIATKLDPDMSIFDKIIPMIIGYLLTGLFCGISGWREGEESHKQHEKEHGVTYIINKSGIHRDDGEGYKIIMFIIFAAFGPIATPISCIVDIVNIKNGDL